MEDTVQFNKLTTEVAVLSSKIENMDKNVNAIGEKIDKNYATREWVLAEFGQTRKIVNSILITLGTSVVLAFAAFVLRGGLK